MMDGEGPIRCSQRTPVPTEAELKHVLQIRKQELKACLEELDSNIVLNAEILRVLATKIKDASKEYRRVSHVLCTKLFQVASSREANELDDERKDMAGETETVLAKINSLLRGIDEAEVTLLPDLSIITIAPSRDRQLLRSEISTAVLDPVQGVAQHSLHENMLNATGGSQQASQLPPIGQYIAEANNRLRRDASPWSFHHSPSPVRNPLRASSPSPDQDNFIHHETHPPRGRSSFPMEPVARAMLLSDMKKTPDDPFNGQPTKFWAWLGDMHDLLDTISDLRPREMLQVMKAQCTGDPRAMIADRMSATPNLTSATVAEAWNALKFRYGATANISEQLKNDIKKFPVIKGNDISKQLHELLNLCKITKYNKTICSELSILDTAVGMEVFRGKLPEYIQREWRRRGEKYKRAHYGQHPPFSVFVDFIETKTEQNNTPDFNIIKERSDGTPQVRAMQIAVKTESTSSAMAGTGKVSPNSTSSTSKNGSKIKCFFHNTTHGHLTSECKSLKAKPMEERQKLFAQNRLCYHCGLDGHRKPDCPTKPECATCGGPHASVLHRDKPMTGPPQGPSHSHDLHQEKPPVTPPTSTTVSSLCTHVCDNNLAHKNCSKTLLVDVSLDSVPGKSLRIYTILDEQSNVTLVDQRLLDYFDVSFPEVEYTIRYARQNFSECRRGNLITGLNVKGVKLQEIIKIDEALSTDDIADTRDEVATPQVALAHKHTRQYAHRFPSFDKSASVLMLIGRDCIRALATRVLVEGVAPYLHETPLGLALVGSVCKPENGKQTFTRVMETHITIHRGCLRGVRNTFTEVSPNDLVPDIFAGKDDDDFPGLSQDDRTFLEKMRTEICITAEGNVQLPLPLRNVKLPDNKIPVLMRTKNTLVNLRKNPRKVALCEQAMQKHLDANHVEQLPDSELNCPPGSVWYVPVFCVEEARKNKVRLVFDASAKCRGISLNSALYQGPDLTNGLRGVLLRFRERPVAFGGDIESMFCAFKVPPEQRNFLRFFWYDGNDHTKGVAVYRASSHIFGCTSSPAVASYGLKFCAAGPQPDSFASSVKYIYSSFYVDDGWCSVDTPEEAIEILTNAREILSKHNIRLHKIVSNNDSVLTAFPSSECAIERSVLALQPTAIQSTLGVAWDTQRDAFIVKVSVPSRPFTKRGVVSVINTLYDPIGIVTPVTLTGRLLQREIIPHKGTGSDMVDYGWDIELPDRFRKAWDDWVATLSLLSDVCVPRCLAPLDFKPVIQELHIFCDASDKAIAQVIYLRSKSADNRVHVSFVTSSAKVAPRCATSTPRLELCAAVAAAHAAAVVKAELDRKPDCAFFYSDSRVVLGYLANTERRFSKYVERRVALILRHAPSEQWHYVNTNVNPADIGTRPISPGELAASSWHPGPQFLKEPNYIPEKYDSSSHIVNLAEECQEVTVMISKQTDNVVSIFDKITDFDKLIFLFRAMLTFKHYVDYKKQKRGIPLAPRNPHPSRHEAIKCLIKVAQSECLGSRILTLRGNKQLPEGDKLSELSPQLDSEGLVRVGGRLKRALLPFDIKHPILIPRGHPLSTTIANYYHNKACHQGSHISHGQVRQAGFHIENGRSLIHSIVKNCVTCKKLRAPLATQMMADLPLDRLESTPPFTHVGIDIFGPFFIVQGASTRHSRATKKVWALICVCLPSRAIHVEPLEGPDTTSFRNAMSRFVSIRGSCKTVISDQGTNFICARKQMTGIDVEKLAHEFARDDIKWVLNPPHASHFGGAYERKIGSVRRVLEASMRLVSNRGLSRDEFHTLLAKASSIVNNTPLWEVPSSPNDPAPLSPAMLITMRDGPESSPVESYSEVDLLAYGQKRYRRVEYLAEQFWLRWRQEYLLSLTKRHKWKIKGRCITPGDIVLLRDKQLPRNQWPMGRVVSVRRSEDGLVRSVNLKLAPLPGRSNPRFATRAISEMALLVPSVDHGCVTCHPGDSTGGGVS